MNNTQKIAEMLTEALKNDPAIGRIILFRVPANQATQDHPTIQVNSAGLVGALGLINGILETIGESRIAAVFEDKEGIENGLDNLVGFSEYTN